MKKSPFVLLPVLCLILPLGMGALAAGCSESMPAATYVRAGSGAAPDLAAEAATESFTAVLDGNTSLSKTMTLTDDYGYWRIWVSNTGDCDLRVSLENEQVLTVPANESGYIYTDSPWASGSYEVNFATADIGQSMSGSAACFLYTSPEDAIP